MNVRFFFTCVAFSFFAFVLFCADCGFCQTNNFETDQSLTANILSKTLYTKTPEENAYCAHVIAQRNSGNLTNKVLYGAYRFAVQKEKSHRFIYFKTALETLCQREGLILEDMPTDHAKKASVWSPSTFFKATTSKPTQPSTSTVTSTAKKPFAFLFQLVR